MPMEVVKKELLADGRIVAYRFLSAGTEAADEWYQDMREMFAEMADDAELLLLLDLSLPESGYLSAEGFMRAREVAKLHYHGKTAVLVKEEDNYEMMDQFLDRGLAATRPRDAFKSEAEAIAWLLAKP